MRKTLLTLVSVAAFGAAAMAADCPQVQSYAHPTLFGSEAQIQVGAKSDAIVGGKITKCDNAKTITGKDNVVVQTFAKKEMEKLAAGASGNSNWSIKSPVLRSELAQTISDGLELAAVKSADKYTDVANSYWAKDAIDRALAADIMIGYPDQSFKPEQRVTKAEVFCTLAKIFDVPSDASVVPTYNGKEIQHIPGWAYAATNEVLATGILDAVPDEAALINNQYLSKEQVTYLVGALAEYLKKNPSAATSSVNVSGAGYGSASMLVKFEDRLSARVSNAGDRFTAKLVESATIGGVTYPAGAKVRGIVSEVVRPGVGNPGFIKVQFKEIVDGDTVTALPDVVLEACAEDVKDPNFLARVVGAPLTCAGRVIGVAARTIGQECNLGANAVEEYGDRLSNTLVDTFCLQPVAGVKNFGGSFVTAGKLIWNTVENATGGVFGVGYEIVDEVRYLFAPRYSNNTSLNPKETVKVTFQE